MIRNEEISSKFDFREYSEVESNYEGGHSVV